MADPGHASGVDAAKNRRHESPLTLRSFESLTLVADRREGSASPIVTHAQQAPCVRALASVPAEGQGDSFQAGAKPRDSSPYVRKERDSDDAQEALESEGSHSKRQRRKSVSFGHTVVRHVRAYDPEAVEYEIDDDDDCVVEGAQGQQDGPGAPHADARRDSREEEEFEPWESREDTKQQDGPAVETVCVDKMVLELFKKRDPSIVMRTLNVIVEKGTMDTIGGVRGRVDGLVKRLKKNGKVSLLPSCVVLKEHSLPVLEWMSDCASKAGDLMAAARGRAPFAEAPGPAGAPSGVVGGGMPVEGA